MKTAHRSKRRRGWLSQMKGSNARAEKTPLWHWILIVPVAALFLAAIVFFVYLSYFNPKLVRGERALKVPVAKRVETKLPDGSLDAAHSYLLVRIEDTDIKLRPVMPLWNSIAEGDTLEVQVGRSGSDGSPVVYSYTKAPAPPPAPAK
jgi:hypothetical protein